ncbi:MAG: 1-phosphofructokinase family hexose kinase [Pleomorphochaeta sp.]
MNILIVSLNPTFQRTMVFDNFNIGEVNRAKKIIFNTSGKGVNAARVLAQKGLPSVVLTHLGKDRMHEMINQCNGDNVNLLYAITPNKMRTCTTILSNNHHTTELVEEANAVDENCAKEIVEIFNKNLDYFDLLIITGTRAPGYDDNIYSDFVKKAKEKNKIVILDICKNELKKCLIHKPNIIKPNLSEFCKTFFDIDIKENEDTEFIKEKTIKKMEEIYNKYNTISILTRGSRPIWVYDNGFYEIPPYDFDKIVNTVGCGDTFLASLSYSISQRIPLKEAIKNATKDAAINASVLIPGSLK